MTDETPIEQPVVEAPAVEVTVPVVEEHYHCSNCKENWDVEHVIKSPLDYVKKADGTYGYGDSRFSVFCKKCQKFLTILDPHAQAQLAKFETKQVV